TISLPTCTNFFIVSAFIILITIPTENAKTSAVKISNGGGMSNSNSPVNSEPSSGTDPPLVTIGIKNRATVYASIPAIIVDIYATPSVAPTTLRSEEHTSELQSRFDLV